MQFTTEKFFCSRMDSYPYLKNDKKTICSLLLFSPNKQSRQQEISLPAMGLVPLIPGAGLRRAGKVYY